MKIIILLAFIYTTTFSQDVKKYRSEKDTLNKLSTPKAYIELDLNQNGNFSYFQSAHGTWDYKVNGIWKIEKDTLFIDSHNKSVFNYPKIIEHIVDTLRLRNKIIVQVFKDTTSIPQIGVRIKVNDETKMAILDGKAEFDFGFAKTIDVGFGSNLFLGVKHTVHNLHANYFAIYVFHKPYIENISHKYLIKGNKLTRIIDGKVTPYIVLVRDAD